MSRWFYKLLAIVIAVPAALNTTDSLRARHIIFPHREISLASSTSSFGEGLFGGFFEIILTTAIVSAVRSASGIWEQIDRVHPNIIAVIIFQAFHRGIVAAGELFVHIKSMYSSVLNILIHRCKNQTLICVLAGEKLGFYTGFLLRSEHNEFSF